MKKITVLIALLLIQLLAFAQSADESVLKQLVRAESEAYYGRNIDAWKGMWHQGSETRRTFVSRFGYYTEVGWDSALANVQAQFKERPGRQEITLEQHNFQVVQRGDMAWVDYDQVVRGPNIDTVSREGETHETRILAKEGNDWKILSQTTSFPATYNNTDPVMVESELNFLGYNLIAAKRLNQAIEVFKLNVKLFPEAWNPYDSLGEAYALAGDKKKAIENYEKSVRLNPKNEGGQIALAKLKQK